MAYRSFFMMQMVQRITMAGSCRTTMATADFQFTQRWMTAII